MTRVADQDGCAPVDFYSTTNHETHIRRGGQVAAGRRSAHGRRHRRRRRPGVVPQAARHQEGRRRRLRRRRHPRRARRSRIATRHGFAFMTQRGVVGAARRGGGRPRRRDDAGASGPTAGGSRSSPARSSSTPAARRIWRSLIRGGYVQVLLSGNALAVHDIEVAMFGTSLGVNLETGRAVEGGHHHHMRAINAVRRAGGIRQAVEQGIVTSGIMYECQKQRHRVRPRRQHPRRWSAAGDDDGSGRGAGSLRRVV